MFFYCFNVHSTVEVCRMRWTLSESKIWGTFNSTSYFKMARHHDCANHYHCGVSYSNSFLEEKGFTLQTSTLLLYTANLCQQHLADFPLSNQFLRNRCLPLTDKDLSSSPSRPRALPVIALFKTSQTIEQVKEPTDIYMSKAAEHSVLPFLDWIPFNLEIHRLSKRVYGQYNLWTIISLVRPYSKLNNVFSVQTHAFRYQT